jgi:hypothetical protein
VASGFSRTPSISTSISWSRFSPSRR